MAYSLTKRSVEENEQLGRDLYKVKQYKEALEAFTEVINNSKAQPLITLDCRAATYEKLNELDLALSDARRIIKHDKFSSVGYLRLGKILQLQQRVPSALKVYAAGLERVPLGDSRREKLDQIYNKIRLQLPTTRSDPFIALPIEIAQVIIKYLDLRTRLRCLRVSKQWKTLIESWQSLWRKLDLSFVRNEVTSTTIKSCIRRAGGQLHTIRARRLKGDAGLRYLCTRTAGNLHCFRLDDCSKSQILSGSFQLTRALTQLILPRMHIFSLNIVKSILKACPLIEVAVFISAIRPDESEERDDEPFFQDCGPFPNLKKLCLWSDRQANLYLDGVQTALPCIEELSIDRVYGSIKDQSRLNFCGMERLKALHLGSYMEIVVPSFPPRLRHLNISGCSLMIYETDVEPLTTTLPELESFDAVCSPISAKAFLALLPEVSKLRYLRLSCFELGMSTQDLLLIVEKQCDLSALRFCHIEGTHLYPGSFDDECAAILSRIAPNITEIEFNFCPITGAGVRTLVEKKGTPLAHISLRQCDVVGTDTYDYLRKCGVRIALSDVEGPICRQGKEKWEF